MKTFLKDLLLALLIGAVLPGILLRNLPKVENVLIVNETEATEMETWCQEKMTSRIISVHDPRGTVMDKELEQYLVGVVLAEMPAYFEKEALKAQAVAARTKRSRLLMSREEPPLPLVFLRALW